MIDHITIHVNDSTADMEFYKKALAPLGYKVTSEHPEWKLTGLGTTDSADVWIYAGEGAKQIGHTAFVAKGKEEVEAFYKEGLSAGGKDNGAPGYRKDYSPGYYAAFVFDPSGNNIEAVFRDPNPTE